MSHERPDPDLLLSRVQQEEAQQARGKLKIFFGMAPGVGKTYAMLQAARKLTHEGVDVLVGYVEPHLRPETQALLTGLELLPRKTSSLAGRVLYEFDLEAALERKPELILVDELAHTNLSGCTHAKRWQDVQDLLAAGIDVWTTLNVQHLESLNDIVAQVTTIPVRETVPDHIFEQADEIELVDLAPDSLIERLKEGRVYLPEQALRAIENFFRKGNLIALRELALRKTADRVNAQVRDYRQTHEVSRIWPTSDRVLVCVGPSPMSARLVRAARRMAQRLQAPLHALHVELELKTPGRVEDQRRLEQNLRLAEELGATVAFAAGTEFATVVLEYARSHNITKIVVGKPLGSRWSEFWRGALVYQLIRRCGDIDIYVISGDETAPTPLPATPPRPTHWAPYFWALATVLLCTGLCYGLNPLFHPTNLVMVYLAGVVGVAVKQGRGPSILATVLGVAAFDLLFVPPYATFAVADTQYLLTFLVMLITGLVISELTGRIQAQSAAVRERARRTAALFSLSKELTTRSTLDSVAETAERTLAEALQADIWIVVATGEGPLQPLSRRSQPPDKDRGVIRWVYDHRQSAGAGTDTLPGTEATYYPLLVTDGIVGVMGVRPRSLAPPHATRQIDFVLAYAGQIAGALERCALAKEAERVRLQIETERLRNALLSTVSHDLRTPLATITGAASLLADGVPKLALEQRQELAESIVDEAGRLNRLVANLLDITRLEAGAITLQRELQPIEEVLGIVLSRMERELHYHPVTTQLADDLPPVAIDGLLIQQVLVNLLDNAAKFSPKGTPIELTVRLESGHLVVEVADRGPGIPADDALRLFEKFYRGDQQARTGSGIGLAICKGIVELHGGTIVAENRPGGGAVFRFTLPVTAEPRNP